MRLWSDTLAWGGRAGLIGVAGLAGRIGALEARVEKLQGMMDERQTRIAGIKFGATANGEESDRLGKKLRQLRLKTDAQKRSAAETERRLAEAGQVGDGA